MRLIDCKDLTKLCLVERFGDDVPLYAILSHTWGQDSEEPTYRDLVERTGKSKAGYRKIQFCAKQAARDGLRYIWVDTCCIDKTNSVELSEAINSMFNWYRGSARCYVYLSDVSTCGHAENAELIRLAREEAFQNSRWFTRGWTLQELIAPASVEFFSKEGNLIGSKATLARAVSEITGIDIRALLGSAISEFGIDERLAWAERRHTKRPEDKAYCLLGIFSVRMRLDYGEGREAAFTRLQKKIQKLQIEPIDHTRSKVLNRLPQAKGAAFNSYADEDEPRCHPATRTSLLRDIHYWVDHPNGQCIFWLKGMAGTGKSTISRTVAEALAGRQLLGASFFFKRGEEHRSNASRFFTTISAQLIGTLPELVPHIAKALDADPTLSDKTIKEQFERLILEPLSAIKATSSSHRQKVIILIDALDECEEEGQIDTILHLLPRGKTLKGVDLRIFVTSRPELPIRLGFEEMDMDTHRDVALHDIPEHIIDHDLRIFLEDKFAQIRRRHSLQSTWPNNNDLEALALMARPLFIYAATICRFVADGRLGSPRQLLEDILQYKATSQASKLSGTYLPVLRRLLAGLYRSDQEQVIERFRQAVGTIITLVDPLSKESIASLLNVRTSELDCVLDYLHSVLRVPRDTKIPIRLLHLSFRDYLLDKEQCEADFWINDKLIHARTAVKCIELMSRDGGLRENMCKLEFPGKLRSEVESESINALVPAELRYACYYWTYHLQHSGRSIRDEDEVHSFLRKHFLHLLEALGLLGKISKSISMITILQSLLSPDQSLKCSAFLNDAKRFVLANRAIIDLAPLQVYSSALIFAPYNSIIKQTFKGCIPCWIKRTPDVQSDWTSQIQILEGHMSRVNAVAFSPNGKQLASASDDKTVRLWDVATGETRQTFKGHTGFIWSVAFSPDGKQLASASNDMTVLLWDTVTGETRQTFNCMSYVFAVAFSLDGKQLALASKDKTVRLRNVITRKTRQTFKGHTGRVKAVAFSPDGKQLASGSDDETVRLWDIATGETRQTLKGHTGSVSAVAFSPDGKQLASASNDFTVRLWDTATGGARQRIEGHTNRVDDVVFLSEDIQLLLGPYLTTTQLWDPMTGKKQHMFRDNTHSFSAVAFSPNGKQLASASDDETVRLWDIATGETRQTFKGHTGSVSAVAFSPDGKQLASTSSDRTVRLWNPMTRKTRQTFNGHTSWVKAVAFSPDGKQLASVSDDKTVRLWDVATGETRQTFEGHMDQVNAVAFSPDGKQLASASSDWTVRLWDLATGETRQTSNYWSWISTAAFSLYGKQLALASEDETVRLRNVITRKTRQTFEGHMDQVKAVAFSPDGKQLASGSDDKTVRLWDIATGETRQTLKGHTGSVSAVAFSPDGKQLASASNDFTVRLWDTATGEMRQTLRAFVSDLRFSWHGPYLETDRGILHVKCYRPALNPGPAEKSTRLFLDDHIWVTLDEQKVLWLPPDFRSACSAVYNSTIAIGCRSGRVVFLDF